MTAFLVALGGNENYSKKREDLLQLVQDASKMSQDERNEFLEEKDENKFLLELFDGMAVSYKNTLDGYVTTLFFNFDLDKDHGLNVVEATVLFQAYLQEYISKHKLAKFLEQIDTDGDSVVQLEELKGFISSGIAMTDLQREMYSSRGKFHGVLLKFLDAVQADRESRLPRLMHHISQGIVNSKIESHIQTIWRWYDIDRDGVLNETELKIFLEHHLGTVHNVDDLISMAVSREPITAALLTNLFSVLLQLEDRESAEYVGLSEIHKAMHSTALQMNRILANRKDPLVYFFLQMWPTFDVDSNGALNNTGTEKNDTIFYGKVPEKSAVTAFLVALGGNENYSLKREDLLQLVQDASKMSQDERNEFLEEKDENKFLLELLDGVCDKYNTSIEGYVSSIFPYCDLDNDDGLNTIEATVLFQSFSNEVCSRTHLEQFLSKVDADGDSMIQLGELVAFIRGCISLSQSQKFAYSSRSNFHQTLLKFCDGVKAEQEKTVAGIAFERLFCEIDTDSSGTITKKELLKSLRKKGVFQNIAENYDVLKPLMNARTFLKTFENINSSNTGEITREEFRAFVHTKVQTSERDIALEMFFKEVDTDNSGVITKKELLKALSRPEVFKTIAIKHESLRPLLSGKTYMSTFQEIAKKKEGITFENLQNFVQKL